MDEINVNRLNGVPNFGEGFPETAQESEETTAMEETETTPSESSETA